jgi:hypothetical protein
MKDLKDGVLLAGFDDVAPNEPRDMSSWLYEHAKDKVDIIDNQTSHARPEHVLCTRRIWPG